MKKSVLFFIILCLSQASLYPEVFRFKYLPGDQYRFISTVEEDIYINGLYSHSAEIINKASVEIPEVKGNSGLLLSTFNTSHRLKGETGVSLWGEFYESRFYRDEFGVYSEDKGQFMPVVRNVPRFPEGPVKEGDSWSFDAYEVHDFRPSFGIPEAYTFPIQVFYTYKGLEEVKGHPLHRIEISYNVFFRPQRPSNHTGLYPVRITGYSNQVLWWDNAAGRPHAYEEEFEIFFLLNDGQEVGYAGTAEAELLESPKMDRTRLIKEIEEVLTGQDVKDASVTETEKGVTITLENIQFLPDSAVLLAGEKEKLKVIAEILSKHPERDLLITGHTAWAGTERGMQLLSEQRAQAVAEYLHSLGAGSPEGIIIQGFGGRFPIGDNSTEEGKRKNRRVEITILEN